MIALSNVTGFLLAATFIIIIPGPATLFVVDKARQSFTVTMAAVAGIVSGDVVLISLSATGFAMLMQSLPWILPALRLFGAGYLIYLAYAILHGNGKTQASCQENPQNKGSASFWHGLLITISNPKPILFFSSFFPLFITPTVGQTQAQATGVMSFAGLGALFELINLLYFTFLCCLVATLRQRFKPGGMQTVRLHQACALGLLLCGLAMVVSLLIPGAGTK